jgi:hypothetical protein
MLLVRTYLAQSPIAGTGLFLRDDATAGTRIWTFDPRIDRIYGIDEMEALPELTRQHLKTFAVFSAERRLWVSPGDDARFINHADSPTTRSLETAFGDDVAVRDLPAGTEITCDYRAICDACNVDPAHATYLAPR